MFLLKPSSWKFGAKSPTSGAKSNANAELQLIKRKKLMSTSFKNITPTGPGGTATLLIVLSFTGFLLLTQSLFVVPSGQVAVITTLGKVSGPSRRAGLNFKLPFVQSVYPFDIKTQVQPEKFETLTKDLQVIRATATVKYSVKPNEAGRIFATIASRNSDVYQKIVQPSLLKALKSVFSQYELETIATEFAVISEKVGDTVAKELNSFDYVDVKSLDLSVLEIAEEKNLPVKFFSKEDLSKIIVPNPSNVVQREIGTPSVAEASCLLAAGIESKLLEEKRIFKNQTGAVTIAVAESKNQYNPTHGEIHIIGSGPGDISFLTNNARKALSRCTVWIGYKMYLDLIKPLKRNDQILIESKLTEEKERCNKAIKLAEEGIKVALISSGESGFYGMAGLLLELLQKIKKE